LSKIIIDDFAQNASPEFIKGFFESVQKTAKVIDLQSSGYRIISNHGKDAAQSVQHFHVHILGGKNLGGLLG
jgi:diadenosine tetraphosphate (Ap4A) HIT family hydrolase